MAQEGDLAQPERTGFVCVGTVGRDEIVLAFTC